jgi:hypothetical protein
VLCKGGGKRGEELRVERKGMKGRSTEIGRRGFSGKEIRMVEGKRN